MKDYITLQWNPSKTDTTGTKDFIFYSEVSLAQGFAADHAPLPIVANSNTVRLRRMKLTILIRALLISAFI